MQNTAKNRAYQRGLKAAGIWKGTKNRLIQWDAACVAAAGRHHLPKWAGHIPVAAGIVLFVSGVLLGGAILSAILLFVAGLVSVMFGRRPSDANSTNHYVPDDPNYPHNGPFDVYYGPGTPSYNPHEIYYNEPFDEKDQ
ncbi:hypothetical protein [Pectobacterium jejuense]|uniref:hypothetical protein n=1 Tax=Pectobacterium TaxID=122277 RepID=UPI00227E8643|nr:hypothetical protein [Pectobacterium jejuense]MCY9848898.1 hypothetical protein [Pectobacterium jejuense]